MMMQFILAALLGWGAFCIPVGIDPPSVPGCEWRTLPAEPGTFYLFRNGVQTGCYYEKEDMYRPYDSGTDTWGAMINPPWKKEKPIQNFGVDISKIEKSEHPHYHLSGRRSCRKEVFQALEGQLQDDSNKLHLTIIGSKDEAQKVLADLDNDAKLAEFKGRFLVQAYRPESPMIAGLGFVSGTPMIYLQLPNGKVVHRQDGYKGPEQLATALRRADPNYDPSKDPDLSKKKPDSPVPSPSTGVIPLWAWIALGTVLLVVVIPGIKRRL